MCFSCVTKLSVEIRFKAGCDKPEYAEFREMIRYPESLATSWYNPFYLFVDDDIAEGIRCTNGCATSAEISKIVICRIVSRFLTEGFDRFLWEELVSLCGKESLRAEIEAPMQENLNKKYGDFWNTFFTYDHFSSQKFWNDLSNSNNVILRHCEEMLESLWEFWDWSFKIEKMLYSHCEFWDWDWGFKIERKGEPTTLGFDYKMLGGYPAPICFFALQYICQHSSSHDLLYAFANKPEDKPHYISKNGMWALFLMKSFELLVKRLGFKSACERCTWVAILSFMNVLTLPTTTITDVKEAIEFLKSHPQLDEEFGLPGKLEILEILEAVYRENRTPYRPFLPPLSVK